jgi:hypothetical protein
MGCGRPMDSFNREQLGEFRVYDNGLIYDSLTVMKAGQMVDSLNLYFETCAPKRFRSLEQGYGTYVSTFADSAEAHEIMTGAICLENLLTKFPSATVLKDIWIAKAHVDHFGKKVIQYISAEGLVRVQAPDVAANDKSTGWVFHYQYPTLKAVYVNNLRSTEIPRSYTALIQYVDCLIDTAVTIFPEAHKRAAEALPENESKLKAFLDLANDFEPAPEEPEYAGGEAWRERWDQYNEDAENWNARRLAALDRKMENPTHVKLLNDAVDEAIAYPSDLEIDQYAVRYFPPARVLSLKRSYQVFRTCGNDRGPTFHATSICQLAVKANQWDIFLRAHLDVMNDYFYDYNEVDTTTGRKTYIRELEQLGIRSVNLLVGTCLRSRDVNINHYQGSVSGMGRALAESPHRDEVIDLLRAMVADKRLDLFNRIAMTHLLFSYNYELANTPDYQANLERINQAVATLPGRLQESLSPAYPL